MLLDERLEHYPSHPRTYFNALHTTKVDSPSKVNGIRYANWHIVVTDRKVTLEWLENMGTAHITSEQLSLFILWEGFPSLLIFYEAQRMNFKTSYRLFSSAIC